MTSIFIVLLSIFIVYLLWTYYAGESFSSGGYRMYFGSGVTPLINKCPSPFCGDAPIGYPENDNYPYLLVNDTEALKNVQSDALKRIHDDNQELASVIHLAGYTEEPNDLIISNDQIKQEMLNVAARGNKDQDLSTGMALKEEGFELYDQAPSSMSWSDAGRLYVDRPDLDNFNKMYYSNPSRMNGIPDERQAIIHYNEAAAYYGNIQGQVPVSEESIRWNEEKAPEIQSSELFDVDPMYSSLVTDPREPVQAPLSGPASTFKKRLYFDDLYDRAIRRRNQVGIEAYTRGSNITNKSRDIMNTVFGPDMDEYEKSQWMNQYEP